MSTIQWEIIVSDTPKVLHYCKKCFKKQNFISSDLFRINAQKSRLDIWLIYRCQKCEETWNMKIHSRIKPSFLERAIYEGYLENDCELARKCAFDRRLLQQNQVKASFESLSFNILGSTIPIETLNVPTSVILFCSYELDIRIEKLLRVKLGISKAALKQQIDAGKIFNSTLDLLKANFQSGIKINFLP